MKLRRIDALPEDFAVLEDAARREGHAFVERLRSEWASGANRFAAPGEALFEVRRDGALVGIGGLNRDPYADDVRVSRVRHVYVLPAHRRTGVGRRLVQAVLSHASGAFAVVHLRTHTIDGDRFYRALGFAAAPELPHATHRLTFERRA